MKKKINIIIMLPLIALTYSCASIKATADQDYQAKQLRPEEGKALVYFVRPEFLGKIVNMKVYDGEKEIGTTKGKTFIYTIVDPGKHLFTCKAENEEEVILEIEANKTYYFHIIPQMGWASARCKLEQVHPSEGNELLQKCTLSKECLAIEGL